ncbi:MAG: hypothetical protein Q4E09_05770 [Eubacteriales bacterium]|nr:hypothetical protein [Eubacteriales bacterium]
MRYISTRSAEHSYSFREAACLGRCPQGGIFVPEDLTPLTDKFWDNLSGLDFWGKMACCLSYFVEDIRPYKAELLVRQAYPDEVFGSNPLKAGLLNPYKAGEMLVLADSGPTGNRRDFANALAAVLYESWFEKADCPILYAGPDLSSVLSLVQSLRKYPTLAGVYFVDRRLDQQSLARLEAYLSHSQGMGFKLDSDPDAAAAAILRAVTDSELSRQLSSAGIRLLPADGSSVISLVTNLSLLLTAFSSLKDKNLLDEPAGPDICLSACDLDLVLAALYLKSMGMPLGQIVLAENSNRIYSDFFRSAIFNLKRNNKPSLAQNLDQALHPCFEALLFELLGRSYEEAEASFRELLTDGQCQLDRQYRSAWGQHITAIYSNDKTLVSQCRSLYETTDYLLDAGACACFAARKLQLRNRQEEDYFVVVSSENPLWTLDLCAESLFSRSFNRSKNLEDLAEAMVEESGIAYPPDLKSGLIQLEDAANHDTRIFQELDPKFTGADLADLLFYLSRQIGSETAELVAADDHKELLDEVEAYSVEIEERDEERYEEE